MTVSAQTPYSSQAANSVTTSFPFAYKIRSNTDIVVVLVDANGVETVQTLGVNYTVSGVGSPTGGSVDFTSAPLTGMTVKTRRVTGLARSTDYQNNGDLLAAILNGDVDAVWLALQEFVSGTQIPANAVRAPLGEVLTPLVPASVRANKALVFDGSGNVGVSADIAAEAAAAAASAATAQTAATQAQTAIPPVQVVDYTALRAYAGTATTLYVTGYLVTAAPAGVAGTFTRDDSDTTTADNGGTVLVASNGKRWKRVFSGHVHPGWFGAVGNAFYTVDGAISAASKNLSSAAGLFTAAMVGQNIFVSGAGASGAPLVTTITTYVSATQVTLTAAASTTVTGAAVVTGADDTTALNNALAAGTVELGAKNYGFTNLTIPFRGGIEGQGKRKSALVQLPNATAGVAVQFQTGSSPAGLINGDISDGSMVLRDLSILPYISNSGVSTKQAVANMLRVDGLSIRNQSALVLTSPGAGQTWAYNPAAGTAGLALDNFESAVYYGGYLNSLGPLEVRGFETGLLAENSANVPSLVSAFLLNNKYGISLQGVYGYSDFGVYIESAVPNARGYLVGSNNTSFSSYGGGIELTDTTGAVYGFDFGTSTGNEKFEIDNKKWLLYNDGGNYTGQKFTGTLPNAFLENGDYIMAETATAQAGGANTITLSSLSMDTAGFYVGFIISITGGTGSGQNSTITAYNGSTKVATVQSNWATPPDGTSVYSIACYTRRLYYPNTQRLQFPPNVRSGGADPAAVGKFIIGRADSNVADHWLTHDGSSRMRIAAYGGGFEVTDRASGAKRLQLDSSGQWLGPGSDNAQSCGSASFRWSLVYAGNGTIQTSDAREKQQARPLSDAERAVAVKAKSLLKAFRFNDAVEKKGDQARWHFGLYAQELGDAFKSEGLDPFAYGVVCYDEWAETPEVRDAEGQVTQEYRPAGNRYGVRYDELMAFLLAAL